jgi:hypothetical protein
LIITIIYRRRDVFMMETGDIDDPAETVAHLVALGAQDIEALPQRAPTTRLDTVPAMS